MGNAKKGSAAPRRAPQHRTSTGRHRQPAPTVAELSDLPTTAGVKIAAAGIVGASAAVAGPMAGLAAGAADAAVATQATAQTPGQAVVFQNMSAGSLTMASQWGSGRVPSANVQVPQAVTTTPRAAAPGQPVPGPAVMLVPNNPNSYLIPANPGNVFSVPAGTTLRFPDDSTFTMTHFGTQNTVYGQINVLPPGQVQAGGPGIPVTTPTGVPLSLPAGAGNSFIVPPGSAVRDLPFALSEGMGAQFQDGTRIAAQPNPAMETATLPSDAVVPLGPGFSYTLPQGTTITTQDNISVPAPPQGLHQQLPSGTWFDTGQPGQLGTQPVPDQVDPPQKIPRNMADLGTPTIASEFSSQQPGSQQLGTPQGGSQQPVLASNFRVPPVSPVQPANPAPQTGGQPGGGSNGQPSTPGQSEFERILNEIKQLQNELSQMQSKQQANTGQQGQQSGGGAGQQGKQSGGGGGQQGQQGQQDPNQNQQDPNQNQQDPNQNQQDPNQNQTDPNQNQTDPNQNQFTNPGDPTNQDPGGNTQVASNSSQSRSNNSPVSPRSTQVAANSGASSSGFGGGFTNAGGSSSGGFNVASGGGSSSGGFA